MPLRSQQRGVDAGHPCLRRHQRHHRCVGRPAESAAWCRLGRADGRPTFTLVLLPRLCSPQRSRHTALPATCALLLALVACRFQARGFAMASAGVCATPCWSPTTAVPIYDSLGESAVEYIVNHSGTGFLLFPFVGGPRLALNASAACCWTGLPSGPCVAQLCWAPPSM